MRFWFWRRSKRKLPENLIMEGGPAPFTYLGGRRYMSQAPVTQEQYTSLLERTALQFKQPTGQGMSSFYIAYGQKGW